VKSRFVKTVFIDNLFSCLSFFTNIYVTVNVVFFQNEIDILKNVKWFNKIIYMEKLIKVIIQEDVFWFRIMTAK
jgi:hypothetical protein